MNLKKTIIAMSTMSFLVLVLTSLIAPVKAPGSPGLQSWFDTFFGISNYIDTYNDETGWSLFEGRRGPMYATLRAEETARAGVNAFGWFDASPLGTTNEIFAGTDSPTMTKPFDPTVAVFGFYLTTIEDTTPYTWYTTPMRNPASDYYDHAWIYRHPDYPDNCMFVCFEDTIRGGDKDHEDMIVEIWASEPIIPWSTVGGIHIPIDKLGLLAPYIASAIAVVAITIGAGYARKRWARRTIVQKP